TRSITSARGADAVSSSTSRMASRVRTSECLAQTDVQDRARLQLAGPKPLAVQLEADVHANRPDRRLIPQAHAGRRLQPAEREVGDVAEHVARVDEAHRAEPAPYRDAQLAVEDRDRVAAGREAVAVDRLRRAEPVECVPAHGRVT